MVCRFSQGRAAFPEEMPEGNPFPGLAGKLLIKGQKFFSCMPVKKGMYLILGFQRKIGAGQQMIVSIAFLMVPRRRCLIRAGAVPASVGTASGSLQQQQLTGDLAVSAQRTSRRSVKKSRDSFRSVENWFKSRLPAFLSICR